MTTTETMTHGIQPCQAGDGVRGSPLAAPGAGAGAGRLRSTAYAGSAAGDHSFRNASVTISEMSAASTSVSE